jgi:hypothetical protein
MATKIKQGDLVRACVRDSSGRRWTNEIGVVLGVDISAAVDPVVNVRWTDREVTWDDAIDLERVAITKLPKELRRTDLFVDDPAGALRMYDMGYRPIPVRDLKRHDRVAYVATDPFLGNAMGGFKYADVFSVTVDDDTYTVTVQHDGGTTQADDGEIAWARRGASHRNAVGLDDDATL